MPLNTSATKCVRPSRSLPSSQRWARPICSARMRSRKPKPYSTCSGFLTKEHRLFPRAANPLVAHREALRTEQLLQQIRRVPIRKEEADSFPCHELEMVIRIN